MPWFIEKYPNHEFSLIMGKDNNLTYPSGKILEVILQNHAIYVYPRIEAKDQLSQYFHRVGSSDLKKSPKSTFN
jgi:nicotinate-nucleotide adenylyltransferase